MGDPGLLSGRKLQGARWVQPFFCAYGIREIDHARAEFYQLLDEFF